MRDQRLVEEIITQELAAFTGIEAAAIYGSWAKDDLHDESDIDLLVIARSSFRWQRLRDRLDELEEVVGRPIGLAGYSLDDFLGRGISPYGFLARILSGPLVPLLGDARALRPPSRSKDYVPRVARDRGIKYGRHRGVRWSAD
jgi:predicted nucleotidyltransferase